ncbi:hypothetical protein O6P43_003223 [Quillaja saponaria]|uniref:Uncharacterized protein n=1 Tax=Quillaja saponaria TaxID=32244 RepID=A0AAD7QE63_QUISA|nr:hypothetical protein O6P43_003223 [Quillaja saponaria]
MFWTITSSNMASKLLLVLFLSVVVLTSTRALPNQYKPSTKDPLVEKKPARLEDSWPPGRPLASSSYENEKKIPVLPPRVVRPPPRQPPTLPPRVVRPPPRRPPTLPPRVVRPPHS